MTLTENVNDLAARVAQEIKAVRAEIGAGGGSASGNSDSLKLGDISTDYNASSFSWAFIRNSTYFGFSDEKFVIDYGDVAASNNSVQIPTRDNGWGSGLTFKESFKLSAEDSIGFEIVNPPTGPGATLSMWLESLYANSEQIEMLISGSNLVVTQKTAQSDWTEVYTGSYDPVAHKWIRIYGTGVGTYSIEIEGSPDGVTWASIAQLIVPFYFSYAVSVSFYAWSDGESPSENVTLRNPIVVGQGNPNDKMIGLALPSLNRAKNRGYWDADKTYYELDVVAYGDNLYISAGDSNRGATPGESGSWLALGGGGSSQIYSTSESTISNTLFLSSLRSRADMAVYTPDGPWAQGMIVNVTGLTDGGPNGPFDLGFVGQVISYEDDLSLTIKPLMALNKETEAASVASSIVEPATSWTISLGGFPGAVPRLTDTSTTSILFSDAFDDYEFSLTVAPDGIWQEGMIVDVSGTTAANTSGGQFSLGIVAQVLSYSGTTLTLTTLQSATPETASRENMPLFASPMDSWLVSLAGRPGRAGSAATIAIGNVESIAYGGVPAVTNTGTSSAAVFDFDIPAGAPGPPNTLSIGTVTTGAADATITGTAPTQTLNLTIPQGVKGDTGNTGPANTLTIGTVTTGASGSAASASITGTAPNQTLNLTIPRGDTATTISASQITDSTATGRSVITAADAAAARTAIGAGTSSLTLGTTAATAKAGNYQPTAANISDSTATGRSVITATDAAAARTAIGAGTSNLAIGTTGTTAAAGNDSRLSDARTPTAHAASHASGGTDAVTPAAIGAAPTSHTHTAANISDSTATGRSVLTATDAAAARTAIGAGTSNLAIGTTAGTAKAGDYQPAAANISDSTTTGRSVLTATDAAAARTAIGAGTSNLALGTTSTTAKAGDYQPTAANISDSTATGRSVITATDAAAARTAIGAGTSSLVIGTTVGTAKDGAYQPTAANISDSTATGRSVLTATDAAAARTAIGAGTSNLAIGTTSTTAKAGDYQPTAANISDSTATGRSVITATDAAAARTAIGAGTGSGDVTLTSAQVFSGVKTFPPGTLLMRGADGTTTAEPYSDVNPPLTFNISDQAATPANPPAGQATLYSPDGKSLRMRDSDGTEVQVGPSAAASGASGEFLASTTDYVDTQPANPSSGIVWFTKNRARRLPSAVGPSGYDVTLQSGFWSNKIARMTPINGVAAPSIEGMAVTNYITPVAQSNATTSFFTGMTRNRWNTASGAGTFGGFRTTTAQWFRSATANMGGFYMVVRCGYLLPQASSRSFIGMYGGAVAITNVDPTTLFNTCGFGNNAADTNFRFFTNAASGTATSVDLGANFPVRTTATAVYEFSIFVPSGNATQIFWHARRLDTSLPSVSGTATTTLPAVNTLMSAHVWHTNNTTAALASIDIANVYIESDN